MLQPEEVGLLTGLFCLGTLKESSLSFSSFPQGRVVVGEGRSTGSRFLPPDLWLRRET